MPVLLGIFFLGFLFARQMVSAEREAGKLNRSKVPPKRADKLLRGEHENNNNPNKKDIPS